MRWIEKLEEHTDVRPDATAIVDVTTGMAITYKILDEFSGKVYHALKKKEIGKEDVVVICLARGYTPFVAAVGVWKAGAAVVIVEADCTEERKEYIVKDSHAALVIDEFTYREMMCESSEKGHVQTDLHDMSYIVYTSGSTGFPKGVVHEFGSLELCVRAANNKGKPLFRESDRFALTTNLRFAATFLLTIPLIYSGGTILVGPSENSLNVSNLVRYLRDYRANSAFFTPSLLKMIRDLPPGISKLMVAAEPVRDIYFDNITIYNLYGQSESGYYISVFPINKAYKTTPIGKNFLQDKACAILDEQGNPAQEGEICYKNPYFRGYLGMESSAIRDSKDLWIHSGDWGKYLPGGDMILTGRLDNMVKIHGIRVELEEVEAVLCDALQVSWVGVRLVKVKHREYLCAYYLKDKELLVEERKESLRQRIPAYMIPSFFIPVNEIPRNANGKFNRNALPAPKIENYQKKYVSPSGRLEEQLCNVMARSLDLAAVGAMDDFFDIGGDSISVLDMLTELNWPYLDISMIYEGKSPRGIAALYKKVMADTDLNLKEKDMNARNQGQELLSSQRYMLLYQTLLPESTMWNIPLCFKLGSELNLDRFLQALKTTMDCHPVFSSRFITCSDSRLLQIYDPALIQYPQVISLSEAEFRDKMNNLVQPFSEIEQIMYRMAIYQTEEANYLFMDFHHSLVDGTSIHIILEDIFKAYDGKKLRKDYLYLNLEEEVLERKSLKYDQGRVYYSKLLDGENWSIYPKVDSEENDQSYGNYTVEIPLGVEQYDSLKDIHGMSKNAFFIAVAILAIAFYNNEENIRISWVFNGRKKHYSDHLVGCLIQDCYIGIRLEESMTLEDFYEEIQEQIRMNLYYSCYNYLSPESTKEGLDASVLYQSGLRRFEKYEKKDFSKIEIPQKTRYADNILDMEILDNEDSCLLYMDYIASMYKAESMQRFASIFTGIAKELAIHVEDADYLISDLRKQFVMEEEYPV